MGSPEGRRFEFKIDVNKLTKWGWAAIILIACIISAGLAVGKNPVTVNVTVEERLQRLEDQVNIPVNSTIAAFLKEADYIISVHTVSGTPYYCLMNGTDDRAGRLEFYNTNETLVESAGLGNSTNGILFLKGVQHNSSLAIPSNVTEIESYYGILTYRTSTSSQSFPVSPIGYIPNPVNGTYLDDP